MIRDMPHAERVAYFGRIAPRKATAALMATKFAAYVDNGHNYGISGSVHDEPLITFAVQTRLK